MVNSVGGATLAGGCYQWLVPHAVCPPSGRLLNVWGGELCVYPQLPKLGRIRPVRRRRPVFTCYPGTCPSLHVRTVQSGLVAGARVRVSYDVRVRVSD